MTDTPDPEAEDAPKKSKLPLILGVLLALLGGGGGFYAVYSGMILGGGTDAAQAEGTTDEKVAERPDAPLPDVAYVALQPVVISLGGSSATRHLRFHAQLEVPSEYFAEVDAVSPRVIDVFNSYLRALDITDFEAPEALIRIRGQLLRRVQIVTGAGRVNDLLVMEFMLN